MDILVTGCERSGTKMLLKRYDPDMQFSEFKPLISFFHGYMNLKNHNYDTEEWIERTRNHLSGAPIQKHSLNMDQNIELLRFIKLLYPDVKIHYIERDPVAVVQSQIFKVWNTSNKEPCYTKSVDDAILQWITVRENCLNWESGITTIHKYEDYCDNKIILPEDLIEYINLSITGL